MNSLSVRISAAFIAIVAVAALLFAFFSVNTTRRGVSNEVDNFLSNRAEEIIAGNRLPAQAVELGDHGDGDDSNNDSHTDSGDSNNDKNSNNDKDGGHKNAADDDSIVQVLGADGAILSSTGMRLPVADSDLRLAASHGRAAEFRTFGFESDELRMIIAADPNGGAVQVARELAETNSALASIQDDLVLGLAGLALAAALFGVLLARRITQPLRHLAASVDQVAATQEFDVAIQVRGDDEVGRLAGGFDKLLQSLSESKDRQQRLVQDAAHELRTPLTSVKANVDMLAHFSDLDAATRAETLASVKTELNELNRLVDEIVDVASDRFANSSFVAIDLNEVAVDAAERCRVRTGRTVDVSLADGPATVTGNRDDLVRAASNLLSNADKYSRDDPSASIDVVVEASGDHIRLTVADRGIGIDAKDRKRIFLRFYRADEARSQPGSGLGLSIVDSIVAAHGATIEVDDGPDGGTVVTMIFAAGS